MPVEVICTQAASCPESLSSSGSTPGEDICAMFSGQSLRRTAKHTGVSRENSQFADNVSYMSYQCTSA